MSTDLGYPYGVAVDASGNVYIGDQSNNAIKVWNASTGQVSTLISQGLNFPEGVALDAAGNLYIADSNNNAIKEWNASTGQVTTLVSTGLNGPWGVAVDGSGNVYIADRGDVAIKEWVASTGQLTTLLSSGLSSPTGVAVDRSGNVYIADTGNNSIKELVNAFAGPASLTESPAAGSDVLLQVVPSTQSLTGVYAPTVDQTWLTLGTAANGTVPFSFAANTGNAPQTANISTLGLTIPVTQQATQTISFSALSNQTLGTAPFTISAVGGGSGNPIVFASTTPGVCTVSGSSVTLVSAGTCTIQATQAGSSMYTAAATVNQSFLVSQAATTTTLTSSLNPSIYGTSVTFTATVAASTATGTITFFDGSTHLGTSTLNAGSTTYTAPALSGGAHSLTAVYSGDANNVGNTSAVLSQVISPANQTITFNALPNQVFGAAPFSVSASATSGLPVSFSTGGLIDVQFGYSGSLLQTGPAVIGSAGDAWNLVTGNGGQGATGSNVPLVDTTGNATTATVSWSAGFYETGAGAFQGTPYANLVSGYIYASSPQTITIAGLIPNAAYTLYMITQADSGAQGRATTFVVNGGTPITTAPAANTGTFVSGQNYVPLNVAADGTGTLNIIFSAAAGEADVNGFQLAPASCSVSNSTVTLLGAGLCTIVASQPGDTSYTAATPVSQNFTVTAQPTSTALTSSSNPSAPGASVSLIATISPSTATGTVTFQDAGTTIGTGTLTAGTATLATTSLSVGTHALTAVYGGDTNDQSSTSSALAQVVNQGSTTTTLTSSLNPAAFNQPVTLTATVAPSTATGTVSFLDGSTSLGQATLNNGTATITLSSPAVATHTLTAFYSGDVNDAPSNSAALTQVVNQDVTTTTLTSSSSQGIFGKQLTLTARVTPSTATGTVTFIDGGSVVGSAALSAGVASINIESLTAGLHSLTASYGGDANDIASTSTVLTQAIVYPPIVISGNLPPGQVGVDYGTAVFTASGGSGSFSWRASGLPSGLSMSSSGSVSGTPAGGFNGSVLVSVTDTASGLGGSQSFSLVISAPLTISGKSSLGEAPPGGSFSGSFTANGGTPPYTWSLSGSGLSVDSSGTVSGAAGTPGSYSASLTITDSNKATATLGLTYAVFAITTTSLPRGTTAGTYSASITAAGGTGNYSFTISGLPAGLSASGGSISGTPTTSGTFTVSVQANDGVLTATSSLPLTITGQMPLSISSSTLPDGTVKQPYSQALTAAGGSPAYTWAQSGGSLPAGLSLDPSGTVTGVPAAAGSYTLGVQVTDTAGAKLAGTVSINIDPAPLTITSGSSLPAGIANFDYPAQILTATGGVAPYNFAVKGTLPAGLELSNGTIAGTPTTPGIYSFTVVATDSATPPAISSLAVSAEVRQNSGDLVLSAASASFAITSGTSDVPSSSSVTVSSSQPSQNLNFTIGAPSASWLTVSGGTTTPATLTIGLTSAALNLTSSGSPYSTTVSVTCTSASCAGNSQTINVTLTITDSPAELSLSSALLSFTTSNASPGQLSQNFTIQNSGGGSLKVNSVTAADSWVTAGPAPVAVAPGPGASVAVTVDPTAAPQGFGTSSINVSTSAGAASIPVTLLVSAKTSMSLGPAGAQFSMAQGGAVGNPNGSFLVNIQNDTPINFTASILPGANWLTGAGSGSANSTSPATVNYSIDQSAVAALPQGAYYATIQVAGSGIVNTPQDYQVVLNIGPATQKATLNPSPAGLVFLSATAGPQTPQTIQVYASSTVALPYQASASTIDGNGWLSIDPSTGSAIAGKPGQVNVSVNSAGLKPGIYRGTVNFSSGAAVQSANVTLVVETGATQTTSTSFTGKVQPRDTAACAGGQLVATQTGLVSNFSAPAAWPTPLQLTIVDTCGDIVSNAQAVATFTNGDPPLLLAPVNPSQGQYSGTWTPRGTSTQATITARVGAPGFTATTVQITGKVTPNVVPTLAPNGTSDVFHPQVGAGLGPGNIVQIYGSNLANQPVSANVLPLPTSVNGTQVIIGGVQAPLFYVSPGQVNAQIPFELQPNQEYQVIVSANGALTTPQPIQLNAGTPAVLQFTSGEIVAQHPDGSLVSDTAPAAAGEYLTLYLTGLGATDIPVAAGQPSPSSPPANVLDVPALTLNDANIPILFAGLTPGLVGLYQINIQLPADLADGSYSVVVSQDGVASNNTLLPVKSGN